MKPKKKKLCSLKNWFSYKTKLMIFLIVLHRRKVKKQNVKIKEISFFHEGSFLHELFLKIVSMALHQKYKKKTLENIKNMFFKKSFSHKTILKIVSVVVHSKNI